MADTPQARRLGRAKRRTPSAIAMGNLLNLQNRSVRAWRCPASGGRKSPVLLVPRGTFVPRSPNGLLHILNNRNLPGLLRLRIPDPDGNLDGRNRIGDRRRCRAGIKYLYRAGNVYIF